MLGIDLYLFGFFVGPVVWGVQMIWIPFWAAGIINGVGHALGYRNFEVKDESRNISPIAIWLGGEELHNNHHADPHSAKFKAKWFEFDIGWVYIRMLQLFGLAKVEYARNYGSAALRQTSTLWTRRRSGCAGSRASRSVGRPLGGKAHRHIAGVPFLLVTAGCVNRPTV